MRILAFECSSERRSVAALDTGQPARAAVAVVDGGRHTPVFHLIEEALARAGLEREAIDTVAVGLGPGSYTGIRLAIAVAQGWQLAREVRLVGLSSMEGLARRAVEAGWEGSVSFGIDAQRREFYLARYDLGAGGPRNIEPLRLVGAEEIKARLARGEVVAGPELGRGGVGGRELFPDALTLARMVSEKAANALGEPLEPIYFRATNFVKVSPTFPDQTAPS